MNMKYMLCIAVAAVALPAAVAPAMANPAGENAFTNVPWGTTDSAAVYAGGGEGGPNMRITAEAHKDWPNFNARVEGSNPVAVNQDPRRGNALVRR
jgi:hypothetical protein